MIDVHYRVKAKKINKPLGKVIYRTDAACGLYSEVLEMGKGMKHTDVHEDVTCEDCLSKL